MRSCLYDDYKGLPWLNMESSYAIRLKRLKSIGAGGGEVEQPRPPLRAQQREPDTPKSPEPFPKPRVSLDD